MPYIAHFKAEKEEPKKICFSANKQNPKKIKFFAQKGNPIKFKIRKDFRLDIESN